MNRKLEELIDDTKRRFTLEADVKTTPLLFFYKREESNGESYSITWFEKDETDELSDDERKTLETFIELAQELLHGRVERRLNYPREPYKPHFR